MHVILISCGVSSCSNVNSCRTPITLFKTLSRGLNIILMSANYKRCSIWIVQFSRAHFHEVNLFIMGRSNITGWASEFSARVCTWNKSHCIKQWCELGKNLDHNLYINKQQVFSWSFIILCFSILLHWSVTRAFFSVYNATTFYFRWH
jgi:hypothetical protein